MSISKNSKSQITNNKQIQMIKNKTQKIIFSVVEHFGFDYCLNFDVWNLSF